MMDKLAIQERLVAKLFSNLSNVSVGLLRK